MGFCRSSAPDFFMPAEKSLVLRLAGVTFAVVYVPYQDRSAASDLTSSDVPQEARVTHQPCVQASVHRKVVVRRMGYS
eukprot:s4128_g9.t1